MAIFLPLTKYFFGGKIWIQIQTINHTKSYGRNSLMKTLETKNAPAAIGPYSQAKMTGNFLFASGQIPVDPATGEVAGDKIETQAEQSCKNVGAILEEAGLTFDNVIKTTCFLADMADFAAFNAVYEKYFTSKPARSCVAVKQLPKNVLCEVEAIAVAE